MTASQDAMVENTSCLKGAILRSASEGMNSSTVKPGNACGKLLRTSLAAGHSDDMGDIL